MLPVHRDRLLDSLEPREPPNEGAPEGISTVNPTTEHMQTQRYPEWLQTCQHLQLIRATRCLFLKSHPRTAAPQTHARQRRKRRERRKGGERRGEEGSRGPCQNSSAVSEEMRQGGGRERRMMSPSAHLERAVIVAHPDAQRRRGGDFSPLLRSRRINYSRANKRVASHPFMCPGVLAALLQAARWRRKAAVGSGGQTGVLRNRAPASCSRSQIRYRNGRSVR